MTSEYVRAREQRTREMAEQAADEQVAAPSSSEKTEKLKADLDEILDEIDEVLEENAAEFAASYVQKGGE